MILRRFAETGGWAPRWLHVVRAISSEGRGRIRYFKEVRRLLDVDPQFRRFFEQETTTIPEFFIKRIHRTLGPFDKWLPNGALHHDPNAYLQTTLNREKVECVSPA
jgi:hypothetical protein